MSKKDQSIGWTEEVFEQESDDKLATQNMENTNTVGCCDTSFHVITSEDEFQKLLEGLQTEGKF